MRVILLSGGSGKRLWPLSNEIRSKVFLKLLPTGDGGRESMIQRACGQLERAGLLASTVIVTHKGQVEITRHHVGDGIPILAEPHKRGTFMAVGLAASYFHTRLQGDSDEMLCVLPVDAFVDPEFYALLGKLPQVLAQTGSEIALIGTVPSRPSSQYGYIVPRSSGGEGYLEVSKFVEKPSEEIAAELIREQALWNCGVFAFSGSLMCSYLKHKGLPLEYEELLERYELLPEMSFDKEVVEHTRHCVVIPYDKAWQDLGDWSVLSNYVGSPVIGEGSLSSDSLHTHLINELNCPIHVIGLSNVIVAASPDGILVANKDTSHTIKDMLKGWQTPKYEEKRWGRLRVLDYTIAETETLTKAVELLPGKNTSYHCHGTRHKIWTILSGSGDFMLDGALRSISSGDVLHIPLGAKHAIRAACPLDFIEIQFGRNLLAEDVCRLALTWEETLEHCDGSGQP